ncbi:MAG: tape measure protein [Clostridia bacterium]|nr:tape measure protein [Clostridia bacterium]
MATIKSSIVVQDMASSVFAKIHSHLTKTTKGFKNLNNEMSVAPTKAINNAEKLNQSALQTQLTYQAELQVLKQVEAEARRIIAAEGIQTAKAQDIIASVREQRALVESLKNNYDNVSSSIKNSHNNQEEFNNSINTGNMNANSLLSTVRNIAIALGGITAVKGLFNLSDEMINNKARLSLIVDDNGSVADLENKIFAISNRTSSDFIATTSVVSKLGILARENFKNTDEIVAFTELMNKNFAISGASIQEQTSAMDQLTQAMATGKLQSDEFSSIMENAPLLAEAIAEYTGKSKGELKELSAEGLITSNIIKNAMFASADQINARYNKMPITWGQIWTRMKNVAVKALAPVLIKINELANNQQVQEMFSMFINGASLAAQVILGLIEGISWLVSILEPVAPIILGVVAAYVAFNIISGITNAMLAINAMITGMSTAAKALHSGATLAEAAATTTATGAQVGLNAALLACPITWIIIAIIALVAILVYLWFTNDKVAYAILYVWDALRLGIMVAGLGIQAVWYGLQLAALYLWLGIQTVVLGLMTAWYGFQTGIEAVCLGVLSIFQGLYNGIASIVNGIISVLNKIPGVKIDTVQAAHFADDFANKMTNNIINRNTKLQEMAGQMEGTMEKINELKGQFSANLNAGATNIQNVAIDMNNTRQDRVDHRNDWIKGAGDAIDSALSSFSFDPSNNGTLGDIAGNTKDIANNTADISEEDLKYLIDLAERETINRFTTVPLTIDLTNNNNINGEQDIDGIVDQVTNKLTSRLEEELEYVSDGIHE